MRLKDEVLGNFIICEPLYQDDKYNWFYRVQCKTCREYLKLREDTIKTRKHCVTNRAYTNSESDSFRHMYTYIVKNHDYCKIFYYDLDSFKKEVLREIGPRPSVAHNLTRIDNSMPYEPKNIKWELFYEIHNKS